MTEHPTLFADLALGTVATLICRYATGTDEPQQGEMR